MSHNDPQLTAYLLGELSPTESAALELQLAASPELRQELDALRGTVAALQSAFAQHVDIQPAVPALDREKLHTLLRSAVGQAFLPASEQPQGKADRNVYPTTVVAPVLLATAPTRGSNSRSWLVAGAVLVVGGLIGLSQWEGGTGPLRDALVRSGPSRPEEENLLALNRVLVAENGRGGSQLSEVIHPTEVTMAHLVDEFNDMSQQKRYADAQSIAKKALALDPMSDVAVQMDVFSKFALRSDQIGRLKSDSEASFYNSLQDVESSVVSSDAQGKSSRYERNWNSIRSRRKEAEHLATAQPTPTPVSALSAAVHNPSPVVGLAAPTSGNTALGLTRLYEVPASPSGQTVYSYYTHTGPADFFGESAVGLEKQSTSFGRMGRHFTRGEWFDDGAVATHSGAEFGFITAPSRVSGRNGDVPNHDVRYRFLSAPDDIDFYKLNPVDGRGLQRGTEVTELTTESLMMDLDVDFTGDGEPTPLGDRLSLFDLHVAAGLGDSGIDAKEGEQRLSESKSESEAQLQPALPSSLTVANYEDGFARLGAAVKGWEDFRQHGDNQLSESPARSTDAAPLTRPAVKEFVDLSQVVADQTRELKELREKAPANAEKPLTEVDPAAAKEAQLALVRVSRELQRQQAVWYYREGYVRQLEATLAAAEQYAHVPENDFVTPESQPLSTFGIDVDTASYSNVRRFVEAGQLPPPDAVRIEELINSFQYEGPKVEGEHPLAVAAEVSHCPWQPQHQLLRVALKGKSIDLQQRPPARLVFLVDTSGSMSDENKLPLVKQSLRILVEQMREQDRLSIVTYSDNAGLLLDSTGGDKREAILAAIEGLSADGSTNGEAGLKLAYEVAVKQFGEGATNRVMLCTDGDFNVGESADSELVKLIEKERQTGVFLNIFGFGSGNLKDAKLEAIADKGNGQYIYIDGIKEARKTLLNELTGTLYTIAKDVKLQIEFNPNLVGSYRLVGYENRAMAAKDFNNDKVDSGDMGAGHSVVALYEIVPPGAVQPVAPKEEVEPLKYKRAGSVSARSNDAAPEDRLPKSPKTSEVSPTTETPAPASTPGVTPLTGPAAPPVGQPLGVFVPVADVAQPPPADPLATELCTIRVRYKQPTSNESTKIETVVSPLPVIVDKKLPPTSRDHVWATAVAQFGLLTRHSTFVGTGNYSQILELAQSAIGDDPTGQRREFVTLVRQTQSLSFERERHLAELSRRAEEHRRVVEEIKTVEKAPDVMTKASCSGKYKTLLRQIEVADDLPTYGEFKDFGRWEGHEYKTHRNLPPGYWVYAAPHWYIWGESTEQAAGDAAK